MSKKNLKSITDNKYILQMKGISKSFSGVPALKKVNLDLESGKVHVLIGENGAGKSTLMKIISGFYQKDDGQILYMGDELILRNPESALRNGIVMIYQELNPILDMTVAENIYIGKEPVYNILGIIKKRKMLKDASYLLNQLDANIDPNTKMKELSIAQMQIVEIARALSYDVKVIIMDEPTSSLSDKETNALFKIIKNLAGRDVAVVYISHKMDEIFRLANTITVLRDGEFIITKSKEDTTIDELIKYMVGRELTELYPKEIIEIGKTRSPDSCSHKVS